MLKKIFSGFFLSILSVVLIFTLFVSIIMNIVLMGALGLKDAETKQKGTKTFTVKETEAKNKKEKKEKILIVPIKGVIADNGPNNVIVTSDHIVKVFEQAAKDDEIKGVILKIQSPGGTITATDKMYNAIMKYKDAKKVPVVAYFDEVAASGGYYVGMTADKIVSHPTTITGSIGVIMSFYEMKGLLEDKLGIKSIVIKSGDFKDIGSSSRPMREDERKVLEDILFEMYDTFLEKVRMGREALREMPDEDLKNIADGRIYTGKQALEKKLVDSLGYFDAAKDSICELATLKKDDVTFIEYQKNENFLDQLLNASGQTEKNIQMMIENNITPKFYYLWKP